MFTVHERNATIYISSFARLFTSVCTKCCHRETVNNFFPKKMLLICLFFRISQMASTTIDAFLLYVSLLSPVSNAGRRKIAADMNQLELAIVPICERHSDLGRSYQVLRAFKTLLLLSPEEISQSSVLGNPVPFYLILNFLISNYAPEELKSPAKYMDWSVTRYIKWLNSSTDQQRVAMIK